MDISLEPALEPDWGAALLARHVAGDALAFPELVERFKGPVFGFFRRSVPPEAADDLFQETFLRVHKDAARYEPRRPFRVWLFTIAHNLLKSHHRRRVVRRVLVDWWVGGPDGKPMDPADTAPRPEEAPATRQSMRWLEGALQALPERPRQALLLTQLEGLSLEEAAGVLGAPVATVKTWVHRGRQALAAARRAHEGGLS
ncbi:MAG: sigma-70 family RNA polymerase sigma factor [Myxococcota bacterium]